MGVRCLLRYIYVEHKDCIEEVAMDNISGYTLAVDGNNFMHYTISKVEQIMNILNISKCSRNEILKTLSNVIVHIISPMLERGINLVVVMDGAIPSIKMNYSNYKNSWIYKDESGDSYYSGMEKNWRLSSGIHQSSQEEVEVESKETEGGHIFIDPKSNTHLVDIDGDIRVECIMEVLTVPENQIDDLILTEEDSIITVVEKCSTQECRREVLSHPVNGMDDSRLPLMEKGQGEERRVDTIPPNTEASTLKNIELRQGDVIKITTPVYHSNMIKMAWG